MKTIKTLIDWCDKNFSAVTEDERLCGMVTAAGKTYDELMRNLRSAMACHIKGLLEDGEQLPEWLVNGGKSLATTTRMPCRNCVKTPRNSLPSPN